MRNEPPFFSFPDKGTVNPQKISITLGLQIELSCLKTKLFFAYLNVLAVGIALQGLDEVHDLLLGDLAVMVLVEQLEGLHHLLVHALGQLPRAHPAARILLDTHERKKILLSKFLAASVSQHRRNTACCTFFNYYIQHCALSIKKNDDDGHIRQSKEEKE